MSVSPRGPLVQSAGRPRRSTRTLHRVLAFGAGLAGVGAADEAHGSVTELVGRLSAVLDHVPRAPEATGQDHERRLVLNGQPLRLVTGRTRIPVEQTLAFYHQRFDERAKAPSIGLRMIGVQSKNQQSGYLVMVDPESRGALTAVARRAQPFLSAGPLRMAFAQRRGSATDYMVVSSDRPLPVELLQLSRDHDAPGQDIPHAPRPFGSVRGMNLTEPAAGYSLVSYRLDSPPEAALQLAKDSLRSAGFQEDAAVQAVAVAPLVAHMHRQGQLLMVRARASKGMGSEVTYLCQGQ